jgi:hypothetical protein
MFSITRQFYLVNNLSEKINYPFHTGKNTCAAGTLHQGQMPAAQVFIPV